MITKFDQQFEHNEWQQTVLSAFQTWAMEISTDIGWSAEQGQLPFGTHGPKTGDPRFGDIRVGARPLAHDVMAISISQDTAISGTWAADVVFNSDAEFSSLDELLSVALHEAGHVFGLDHSDDPSSPMHVHGVSSATELTALDLAHVRQLNGVRTPDQWEGDSGNDELSSATTIEPIESVDGVDGSGPAVVLGDITEPGDVDFYAIEALGKYTGPLSFRLQTAGISLLAPELTIFTSSGETISQMGLSTPAQTALTHTVPQANPDETYLVRVQSGTDSGTDNAFSVGAYSLVVAFDEALRIEPKQIDELVFTRLKRPDMDVIEALLSADNRSLNEDQGTDDDPDDAFELEASIEFEQATRYGTVGSISGPLDIDFYKLAAPEMETETLVMNVSVQSLQAGRLIPDVTILDEDRSLVEAQTLVNGGGEFLLQATSIIPDKEYFIRISGTANSLFDEGDYQMTVSFSRLETETTSFVNGAVGNGKLQDVHRVHVATPQLMHLSLSVDQQPNTQEQGVLLRVLDETDRVVHQIVAKVGETRTAGSVLLTPGTYRTQAIPVVLPDSQSPPVGLSYQLSGAVVSDPFAVDPEVPSDTEFSCPDVDDVFCYPGGIMSEDPFVWLDFLDSLPEIPDLKGPELHSALLGDWWSWYWRAEESNVPPLAANDEYEVRAAEEVLRVDPSQGVLANDIDPDDSVITAVLVEQPQHGILILASDGSFTYQPDTGYSGNDTFTYQAFDFQTPSSAARVIVTVQGTASVVGDFNHDAVIDEQDIDLLAAAIRTGADSGFDVDQSGVTDDGDWQFMIESVVGTTFGDANLDGIFDSSDLVLVFQAGQYEDNLVGNSSWSTGDWNGDGEFDTSDLVFAFQTGGYVSAAVQFEVQYGRNADQHGRH